MTLTAIKKMNLAIHGKDESVITALLKDANVTSAKIAEGAVDNSKIAADAAIAWSKMAVNASVAGTTRLNGDVTVGTKDGEVETTKVSIDAETGNIATQGDLTVAGNLIVQGSTTTLNTQEVTVEDKLLQLGYIAADENGDALAPIGAIGISVFNGMTDGVVNGNQASVVWDADKWKFAALAANGTVGALQDVQMNDLGAVDISAASLTLTADLSLGIDSNILVGTDKFTVDGATGDTVVGGELLVKGAADFEGALSVLDAEENVVFSVNTDGDVVAASFAGVGSLLTALDASAITLGELDDNILSDNVMLLDAAQTVTGVKTFNSSLTSVMTTATDASLKARVTGDTQDRVVLQADGKVLIGSGSAAADVNLYRDAANVLKTDDKLVVAGDLNVMTNADIDGTLNVDLTANVVGDFSVGAIGSSKFVVTGASGNLLSKGDIVVKDGSDAQMFKVAAASGNTQIAGTLNVEKAVTFQKSLTVMENLIVNGTVTYINTQDTQFQDRLIELNRPENTSADDIAGLSALAGISIFRGKTAGAEENKAVMIWDETDDSFKSGTLTSGGTFALADFRAANFYGNGQHITGLKADQVGIDAITGLNLLGSDPLAPATNVQDALESIQDQLDEITGGGSASLSTLSTQIGNVITGLGFDAVTGAMTAFDAEDDGTSYITGDDVREALVDLDVQLKAASDSIANHIADTVDAHDASAISVLQSGGLGFTNVQGVLEDHETRLDTAEAKAWRQVVKIDGVDGFASSGVTSLNKPSVAPAIPNTAATQVFIDGRKVFKDINYSVAGDGSSISFAALAASQTIELLYWA